MSTDPEHTRPLEASVPHVLELINELGVYAETDSLIAAVRPAFSPDTLHLSFTGLSDLDLQLAGVAVYQRRIALKGFITLKERFFSGELLKRPKLAKEPIVMHDNFRRITEEQANLSQRQHQREQRLENLENRTGARLKRSKVLDPFLFGVQCIYSKESPPVWEPEEVPISKFSPKDTLALFGQVEASANLTLEVLAGRMRARFGADLTQQTLKDRFDTFLGITNLEISRLIFQDLFVSSGISHGVAKKAQNFAIDNQQHLLGADLLHKQSLLEEVAQLFKDHGKVVNHPAQKRALRTLSEGLLGVNLNLDEFLYFFTNVYNSLGFDLPPILQYEEETPANAQKPIALGSAAVARAVVVIGATPAEGPTETNPEPASVPPDPKIASEIATRTNALYASLEELREKWTLKNNNERKKYKPVVHRLEEGFTTRLGAVLLQPMPNDLAQEIVSLVVILHRKGGDKVEEVHKDITAAIQEREKLLAEQASLRKLAEDNKISERLPQINIPDVKTHLRRLAKNWHAYRQFIVTTWPPHEAIAVVESVARLFRAKIANR